MANILVADDAAFARNVIKSIVESAGHRVAGIATNGKEACELYEMLKPDLVTMDILMGKDDGTTAIRNIRKKYPKAKIVVVSVVSFGERPDELNKLGVSGYVQKPVSPEALVSAVEKALKEEN